MIDEFRSINKPVSYDQVGLKDRLIKFAVLILEIAETLPGARGSQHLGGQLIRSGTAPALPYGEAQSAESRRDFIHKMKVALKELRESLICLKILNSDMEAVRKILKKHSKRVMN